MALIRHLHDSVLAWVIKNQDFALKKNIVANELADAILISQS